jgi:hypothetical protein
VLRAVRVLLGWISGRLGCGNSLSTLVPYSPCGGTLAMRSAPHKAPPVRAILGISCLLLGVAMLSCRPPLGQSSADRTTAEVRPIKWVRTVDGWERPENWTIEAVGPPRLHPLVVAAGQALFSALALAAVSGTDE